MIGNSWYIVVPFAKGYLGISKRGTIYGKDRMAVISHLLQITYVPGDKIRRQEMEGNQTESHSTESKKIHVDPLNEVD